jgi:signal transduction histidine kinase
LEGSQNIDFVFWLGTCLMLTFVFALIIVVLAYQRHFLKIRREEAALMLETAFFSEMKERQRVAADLHDSVLGDLGAIRLYLSILKKEQQNAGFFNDVDDAVVQAIENTRLISYNLMPPLLESHGFSAAVHEHFERLTSKTGIVFKLQSTAETSVYVPSLYALYRVIQEFANNMIKYGNVTQCLVALDYANDRLSIEITDDGQPYDFEHFLKESKGLGLKNIKSRLETIGASLQQRQVPIGNQFTITLKI